MSAFYYYFSAEGCRAAFYNRPLYGWDESLSKKPHPCCKIRVFKPKNFIEERTFMANSLAHTNWECKYHIVFAPKYRREVIYGKMKAEIVKILRKLCYVKERE